jgi:hypothetical protein
LGIELNYRLIVIRRFIGIRIFCTGFLPATLALAQNALPPASPTTLEQTARQKTAEWEKLAQSLDASILRLLPCDPKAAAAITEVSKASDARVAALAAYLQEASRQASLQTAAAQRVLASMQPLGAELSTEKLDLEQEKLGVDGQIAALASVTESGQRRIAFDGAQDALRQIVALEQQRSGVADSGIGHGDEALGAVRELNAQLTAREAALKEAQAAFETEKDRWSAYYAARLARAQTECNASKGLVTTPARPQGKQK